MTAHHDPDQVGRSSRTFRWVIGLIPLVLLIFLLNQRFTILTDVRATLHPNRTNGPVNVGAQSIVQTATPGSYRWVLNRDVVNFEVRVPRQVARVRLAADLATTNASAIFWSATNAVEYENVSGLLWSKMLNELAWHHLAAEGLTLWQRPERALNDHRPPKPIQQFRSIHELMTAGVEPRRIAVAAIDQTALSRPAQYHPSPAWTNLPVALRGPQKIWLYAANEDINIEFSKVDLNFASGADQLTVRLRRADTQTDRPVTWLFHETIGDDGITDRRSQAGSVKRVIVHVPDVQPGMYFFEVVGGDDVTLRNFRTTQSVMGWQDKLYLADGPAYDRTAGFHPVTVRTNVAQLTVATYHDQGRQRLTIGKRTVDLQTIRRQVTGPAAPEFTVTKPDLSIQGAGSFTLAPLKLPPIVATNIPIDQVTDLDQFDYLIAPYEPIRGENVYLRRELPLNELKINSKKSIGFSLLVPGLRANDSLVGLKHFSVTFERGPIPWGTIWQKLFR